MRSLRSFPLWVCCVTLSMLEMSVAQPAQANVLYQFANGVDGGFPNSLAIDGVGNLYGTASDGGQSGVGTVFRMTRSGDSWSYEVLYSFQRADGDGQHPVGPVVLDASGNLFGTTEKGGTFDQGTVFELSPSLGGQWTEQVLYSFGNQTEDGAMPQSGVIPDPAGNLFGTTAGGGITSGSCPSAGCGAVFQLTPSPEGGWAETVLYRFQGGDDGENPRAGLVLDSRGALYGTTFAGGGSGCKEKPLAGCGTVFQLSSAQSGSWTESLLYAFHGKRDGAGPFGNLTLDTGGNLYGMTYGGGVYGLGGCDGNSGGCGIVFELSPSASGSWTGNLLHSFRGHQGGNKDGGQPRGWLVFDASARLYGTTTIGGAADFGTVFRLTPSQSGKWTEERYAFPSLANGCFPTAGVVLDAAGNVYGTTSAGGADFGVVFEIIPPN